MSRSEKIIESIDKVVGLMWESIPEDIAIDVTVYVRDRSKKCRIDDATLDGEIRTRRLSKGMMYYDVCTVKAMNDTWYNTQEDK